MKRKVLGVFFTAMCLCAAPVMSYAEAQDTETTEAAEAVGEDAEASETEAASEETGTDQASATELSDNLYDFQIKIGDKVYQFPMYYEEFAAQDWTLGKNEDPEMGVSTNSYGSISFYKGDDRISVDVINLGINEVPVNQCLVAGIDINANYDFDAGSTPVELPGGIIMGKSSLEDIKAAYGDPSDTYEGDLYTQYTYSKDYYEEIRLSVYKDDNTLKEIDLRNYVEPEGFDKGSVSDEVPEIVSSYTAPTELSDDILAPQVEYCGDLYSLPAPVSAFLANGWELQDVADDAYVAGRDLEFVDMMKNNQSVHFSVYNFTQNATSIENCFVRDLEIGSYDSEALTLKLSGGYTLGAKKADLIAAAEAKGYEYAEDGDYLNIYKTADTKIDNRAQFWFNKDEDPDTVASVEYLNEILPE
ncbi:hypothetical protein ACTQWG_14895 [Blautia sp. HCP3S3_H10_1]|uniref:hypothetical protein n=1 Tax=unclassified Blautia TaxID=2648079 RepID=UPI003F92D2DE